MHRKHIRRWHKLLSVSGILVAMFAGLTLPMANAATSDTTPTGIYGLTYYNSSTQVQYIDFPTNISGLDNSDFYFSGTSTGCSLYPVPNITAFSFAVTITGCSEGTFFLHLKAHSVTNSSGQSGPEVDFKGAFNEFNAQTPVLQFQNVPLSVTDGHIEFQLASDHPLKLLPAYDYVITGDGCDVSSTSLTTYGMVFVFDGCRVGENAGLTLMPSSIRDIYGNQAPGLPFSTPMVAIVAPSPTASPSTTAPVDTALSTPTESAPATTVSTDSPTPTISPTASPTPTPTPTASSSPSPSDPPASVAVVVPPTDPPTPPYPPTVPERTPVIAPVSESEPVFVEDEPIASLTPIAVVRSKIVQLRKNLALPKLVEPVIKIDPPLLETPPLEVEPALESQVRENFNWQPIGYLAIAVGGAAATVGLGILLQRKVKVRKLRFS